MTEAIECGGTRVSQQSLTEWDRHHSWHPFTPMTEYLENEPLMICEGRGVRLRDASGKWYLDGSSSVWLNVFGHRADFLDQAVTDQLKKVAHATMLGQAHAPATILAKRLVDVTPEGLTRVQFSDSGATAVEIAIKLAIQFWDNQGLNRKRQILGFHNNYHGDTLGAMGVAASELFHRPFLDLLPNNPRLPYPADCDTYWIEPNTTGTPELVEGVSNYLTNHADQIAAVIIEPVEGAGGMIPAKPGYLHQLQLCCRQHDVLLIVDEIATGFGHTGHWFACDAESVTPDILCLGKGLTGGYLPVAATLTTETIYQQFLGPPQTRRTFYHGHSYAGNPLGCAAAIATLNHFPELVPSLHNKSTNLHHGLAKLDRHAIVGPRRQRGMMCGIPIELPIGKGLTNETDPWELRRLAMRVAMSARRHGLLIRPIGNVVILLPPPGASMDELEEMVDCLDRAIADVCSELR